MTRLENNFIMRNKIHDVNGKISQLAAKNIALAKIFD